MTCGQPGPADRSRIEHLGEAGVLRGILPHLEQGRDVEVGPGDDAAVVRLDSPRLVVTTDTLTEGRDFLLGATRPTWIGAKAATQNLADVAAMGARPQAVVVSLSAPGGTELSVLEGISAGLATRCKAVGASVVGGDLGGADALSITVTALGSLPEGRSPITRSGARPGDVIALGAQRLGRSAAGLAFVLADRADDEAVRDLVAWHAAPDPELSLGWEAAPGRATSMIDLSDGLSRDGARIAEASGVVLDLAPDALVEDTRELLPAARLLEVTGTNATAEERARSWVLHGGEEHALLATFPVGQVPAGFREIGRVRAPHSGEPSRLLRGGKPIAGQGWDHFA